MTRIYVDADACPVKAEVERVAGRYGLSTVLVSNQPLRGRYSRLEERVTVGAGFDEADNWIAERCGAGDIVVTSDIPLAKRCIDKGAQVLTPTGRKFTPGNIGSHLATRELNAYLREAGEIKGYNAPFAPQDRSRFLLELDNIVQMLRRTA